MSKSDNSPRAQVARILSGFDPLKDNLSDIISGSNFHNKAALNDYACGVVKNRTCIDSLLGKIASVKESRVEPLVLNTLRIGVYELVYKPLTPEYAVINEAVSGFKSRHKRGFINAVLRNVQRNIKCRDVEYSLDAKVVPSSCGRGCEFVSAIAPSAENDAAGYLSQVFSLPQWLVEGWLANFTCGEVLDICMGSNRVPSVYVRPNSTLTDSAALSTLFTQAGVQCSETQEGMVVIEQFGEAENVFSLPGYEDGLFCVQDETAAKVARFMAPEPESVIVDLCAAPGTKTTHIAELLKGTGRVIATDINPGRLERVGENAERLKLDNIDIVDYDKVFEYMAKMPKIDAVLIDAPCSNTGVLAKRLEARYRLTKRSLNELADTGLSLLNRVCELKSCQQVFYSTCSIEETENTQVLHRLFQTPCNFVQKVEQYTLPSCLNHGNDGGYVAKLVRE